MQPDPCPLARPQRVHALVAGDDVVVIGAAEQRQHGQVASGHQVTAEGVFTYKTDDHGKLAALRAYWEVDQATASTRKI